MTKHTPAPWVAEWSIRGEDEVKRGWHVFNENTVDVYGCVADCVGGVEENGEAEANARLIAAAPELLEALVQVIGGGYLVDAHEGDDIIEIVNQAIAKARGQ